MMLRILNLLKIPNYSSSRNFEYLLRRCVTNNKYLLTGNGVKMCKVKYFRKNDESTLL